MNILVTGSSGFIGSHFVDCLCKNFPEITVYGIDNHLNNYSIQQKEANLKLLLTHKNFVHNQENVMGTKLLQNVPFDEVYHFASTPGVRKSLEHPVEYIQNNVESFVYLLEECRKTGVKRVVYVSSSSVYGNNTDVPYTEDQPLDNIQSSYAVSKRCMEIYAQYYSNVYKMNTVGLRFFTVYGPRGRPDIAPFIFLKNIHEGVPINQHGDGSTARDYTFIDDIISGVMAIFRDKSISNTVYNLGNSNPVSLNKFIETCETITKKQAVRNSIPIPKGDVNITYASIKKAANDFQFIPRVEIDEGLQKMYEWMLSSGILSA